MSSSLPEGVTARPADEADASAAAAVHYDAESALRGRSLWDAGDVLGWWRLVELPTDTWLLHEDGELVAVGTLILHGGAGQLGGAVRPDHVGRGLGGALLALAEERSRTAGADALRVDVCAEDEGAVALLTKRGHRDVRHYFTMRIDLDEPPAPPQWPDGIRPDTFQPGDASNPTGATRLYESVGMSAEFEDVVYEKALA